MFNSLRIRIIVALVTLVLGAGVIAGAYFKGRSDANNNCVVKEVKSELKGMQDHADMERKVRGVDEPRLDSILSQWVQ